MSNKPVRPTLSLKASAPAVPVPAVEQAERPLPRSFRPWPATVLAPEAPKPERRVRLTDAFGFINEYDANYFKLGGTIVTNPAEIAVLIARGAPLEDV